MSNVCASEKVSAAPYRKFTQDIIIIGIITIIQFFLGLLLVPMMTKTLGSHDYGIWTQFNVTASLILPFTNLGLGSALIRFLAAEQDKGEIREQFYSLVLVLSAIHLSVALAIVALAKPLADNFFDGAVNVVMLTGFFAMLGSITGTYLALLRAFHRINMFSIFTIAEEFFRFGLISYLLFTGRGVFSITLSIVVTKLIMLTVLFFTMKSQIGINWPRFSKIGAYLRFGLPLVPGGISIWLLTLADRYIISFFLGVTSVAVYSVATTLGTMAYSLVGVFNLVQMQTLSKLYDEGKIDEVKTLLRYSLKGFLAVGIPFLCGAAILARPILMIFSNPEIANEGYLVTPVSAFSTILLSIITMISYNLVLSKKTRIIGYTWIGAAVINIGLNLFIVPLLGIIGASVTSVIVFSLALGIIGYYSFKEFKFDIDWLFIAKSLIASAIMSAALLMISPQGYRETLLTVLAGAAIYWVVIILLRGFSKGEIALLLSLLPWSSTSRRI